MIKRFIEDVDWGDLDFLLIDLPPGTSDEHIASAEILREQKDSIGAILVTTPQIISVNDVRREITFCKKANLPIIGIIENMSGYVCPECSHCNNVFSSGGGSSLAAMTDIPFLGSIPIDPNLAEACDSGKDYAKEFKESPVVQQLKPIAALVSKAVDQI